jgi:hypothetical protein
MPEKLTPAWLLSHGFERTKAGWQHAAYGFEIDDDLVLRGPGMTVADLLAYVWRAGCAAGRERLQAELRALLGHP